jgi:hypothetical protein
VSDSPANAAPFRLIDNVEFGDDVTAWSFASPYDCRIAAHTGVGASAEVQTGAVIGAPAGSPATLSSAPVCRPARQSWRD